MRATQVKLYGCAENRKPHVKDAFHRHIIHQEDCLNPQQTGTKACVHYHQTVPAGRVDGVAAAADSGKAAGAAQRCG